MAHGLASVDPAKFAERLKSLGISIPTEQLPDFIPAFLQALGGRNAGHLNIPPVLSDVVAKLLEGRSTRALCDPWAGLGTMLAIAQRAKSSPRCIAFNVNASEGKLAKALFPKAEWRIGQPREFAFLTYVMAIGILFRVLYPSAPRTTSLYKSSHPHPAVRACLVASSTMARGLHEGTVTVESLNSIVAHSIGNIEDVWADLCLSGQNPETPAAWAQSVGDAAMALFTSYGNTRMLFEKHARLPRRWDHWNWPEPQESV